MLKIIKIGCWLNLFLALLLSLFAASIGRPLAFDGADLAYHLLSNMEFYVAPPTLRYIHVFLQAPTLWLSQFLEGDGAARWVVAAYCFTYALVPMFFLFGTYWTLARNKKQSFFIWAFILYAASISIHQIVATNELVATTGAFLWLFCLYVFESSTVLKKRMIWVLSIIMMIGYEAAVGYFLFLLLLALFRHFYEREKEERSYIVLFSLGMVWHLYLLIHHLGAPDVVPFFDYILDYWTPFFKYVLKMLVALALLVFSHLKFASKTFWSKPLKALSLALSLFWSAELALFFINTPVSGTVATSFSPRSWGAPFAGVVLGMSYLWLRFSSTSIAQSRSLTLVAFLFLVMANWNDLRGSRDWQSLIRTIREDLKQEGCVMIPEEEYQKRYDPIGHPYQFLPLISVHIQGRRQLNSVIFAEDFSAAKGEGRNPCLRFEHGAFQVQKNGIHMQTSQENNYYDFSRILKNLEPQ